MFPFTKEKMAPQREGSTHAKKKKKWREWMGGKDGGSRDEEEQSEQPHPPLNTPKGGILRGHEAGFWKCRNEEGNILYL